MHQAAEDNPGGPPAYLLMTHEDLGLAEDLAAKLRAVAGGQPLAVRSNN